MLNFLPHLAGIFLETSIFLVLENTPGYYTEHP